MVKFILIKSPDEWATTKQACRDSLFVFFFHIFIYLNQQGWKSNDVVPS